MTKTVKDFCEALGRQVQEADPQAEIDFSGTSDDTLACTIHAHSAFSGMCDSIVVTADAEGRVIFVAENNLVPIDSSRTEIPTQDIAASLAEAVRQHTGFTADLS